MHIIAVAYNQRQTAWPTER